MTLESPLMALRRAQLSTLGATSLAEALATTRLVKVALIDWIEKMEMNKNGGVIFKKGKCKGGTRKVGVGEGSNLLYAMHFSVSSIFEHVASFVFGPSPLFTILASIVCCQVGFILLCLLGSSSTLVVFLFRDFFLLWFGYCFVIIVVVAMLLFCAFHVC